MGSYCIKGFYRKALGMGGSIVRPTMTTSNEVYCEKCKIKVKKIKKVRKSHSTMTGRGQLDTEWNEVTIKCPRCKMTGKVDENYSESDGSYYSNEERRVYRIRD